MSEQPPGARQLRNVRTTVRVSAWLMAASLIASCLLLVTNRRGWTDTALWVPPAVAAILVLYCWAFSWWIRWGESRRAAGKLSLFGRCSRVGATSMSDWFTFNVVVGGGICLVSGFFSRHFGPPTWFPTVLTLMAVVLIISIPEGVSWVVSSLIPMLLSSSGLMLLYLFSSGIRLDIRRGDSLTLSVTCLGIGLVLLAASVFWHARYARDPGTSVESPAP